MPAARDSSIRQPAVAGQFYPDGANALGRAVDGLLAAASPATGGAAPKAVIAPHAGFAYSGPVAAAAYARLRPLRHTIRRVVLLGPAHRVPFRGMALSGVRAFRTPLGDVPVDTAAIERIKRFPEVSELPQAHAGEHSLEVHLPFLQRVFADFALLPIVVSDASPAAVAAVIEALWGGAETLIVVSSDLSHYEPCRAARAHDRGTAEAIERLDPRRLGPDDACGCIPIAGLLAAARTHGLECLRLDLRNSGDTAGAGPDEGREVVGYGAWAFTAARASAA
ncbi:MAG TPA: AmmeMemoRadiSam system protein B [Alphaproteobacteria bacterium]|jgi:AmmeMemoRadiSam system protein B